MNEKTSTNAFLVCGVSFHTQSIGEMKTQLNTLLELILCLSWQLVMCSPQQIRFDGSGSKAIPEELLKYVREVSVSESTFLYHDSFTLPFGMVPNPPGFFYDLDFKPIHPNLTYGDMRHKFHFKEGKTLKIYDCLKSDKDEADERMKQLVKVVYFGKGVSKKEKLHNACTFAYLLFLKSTGISKYPFLSSFELFKPMKDLLQYDEDCSFARHYSKIKSELYDQLEIPDQYRLMRPLWPFVDLISRFLNPVIIKRLNKGPHPTAGAGFMRLACKHYGLDGFKNCVDSETVICDPYSNHLFDLDGSKDFRNLTELAKISTYLTKIFDLLEEEDIIKNKVAYINSFIPQ